MKKAYLRRLYLGQRQAMDATEYRQYNRQIYIRFLKQFNVNHYPCLHIYLACPERKEVDTWNLVYTLLVNRPKIVVAAPKLLVRYDQIENLQIDQNTAFKQHAWGMKEPISGVKVPANDFLLVVLPVISFDEQGYRSRLWSGILRSLFAAV